MNKLTTVCFTGHRPHKLGGYDQTNDKFVDIKRRLEYVIEDLIDDGYDTFISGMAIGVDQLAAEIVLNSRDTYDRDIKLISAVPFKGQECKWRSEHVEQWQSIIDKADDVVYVSDAGYTHEKMQIRNEWMVDQSTVVVAVWDGSNGGTANCVSYADKIGCNMIRVDPNGDNTVVDDVFKI